MKYHIVAFDALGKIAFSEGPIVRSSNMDSWLQHYRSLAENEETLWNCFALVQKPETWAIVPEAEMIPSENSVEDDENE